MLKFAYLAQLGLAGTVIVPAVVLEQDPAGGLMEALANTRASLESLEQLHSSLTSGDHSQVAATLEATEAPTGDAQLRDERLSYLREEVSRLQMRWETLEEAIGTVGPPSETPAPAPMAAPITSIASAPSTELAATTTGLDEATRSDLVERLSAEEPATPTTSTREKISYEPVGFTAHPVRHGRALYKAGRYDEAIALLKRSVDQVGARFWIACSLEKLGRVDEAIKAYEVVAASPADAKDAERAKRNRDFLVWKRDFDARILATKTVATLGETL